MPPLTTNKTMINYMLKTTLLYGLDFIQSLLEYSEHKVLETGSVSIHRRGGIN